MSDEIKRHGAKGFEMSNHRHRKLDRDTMERLLQGSPPALRAHGPLGEQLAAAAAPAHPHELTGRSAALAAFQAARLEPVPDPRSSSRDDP